MVKIRSIDISGIRGIRRSPPLDLNGSSVLVFGENGSGKSSLTDAIEWYYSDGIQHLVSEEIESTKGRGALRNLRIPDEEDAYIAIQYSNSTLDSKKSLDSSFRTSDSNRSDEFDEYMVASESENLILRYTDLVRFIIAPKTERLKTLQRIIGFGEVADVRDLLKKSAGRVARSIKSANYDNQKNAQQAVVLENLGQNAYTNKQLFAGANELIRPLKLGKAIKSLQDIQEALVTIETKEDTALLEEISFQTRVGERLDEVAGNVDAINASYQVYHRTYTALRKDPGKLGKIQLLALLKEGQSILVNDVVQDDYCPLCRQEKSKIELIAELNERVKELEELEREKDRSDEQGRDLKDALGVNISTVDELLKERGFKEQQNSKLADKVVGVRTALQTLSDELKKDLNHETPVQEPSKVRIDKAGVLALVKKAQETAAALIQSKTSNVQFQIYTKLFQSVTAYKQYQRIDKMQAVLTRQQVTFEALFADLIRRQEQALNSFLTMFSANINDYYTAMNPGERVEDINLVTVKDKNNDLAGISIEYRFFDETKKGPSAYLSESHVNCLGLSFFLASVRAFNKENRFIVLDDVISSFDRAHRTRFTQLLTGEFSDYQILLLTHEQEFFELVSSEVKGKGWLIRRFVWSEDNGSSIEHGVADLRERIQNKFRDKNIDGLGNDMRIYTERVMKEISNNIDAQVAFRYNEHNEKRMASELLDAVHSRVSRKGSGLKEIADIPRLKRMPMFIANIASHDSKFNAGVEDLAVMWEGICETIGTFYCNDCETIISTKYFDSVESKIRCKCGNLAYDWRD